MSKSNVDNDDGKEDEGEIGVMANEINAEKKRSLEIGYDDTTKDVEKSKETEEVSSPAMKKQKVSENIEKDGNAAAATIQAVHENESVTMQLEEGDDEKQKSSGDSLALFESTDTGISGVGKMLLPLETVTESSNKFVDKVLGYEKAIFLKFEDDMLKSLLADDTNFMEMRKSKKANEKGQETKQKLMKLHGDAYKEFQQHVKNCSMCSLLPHTSAIFMKNDKKLFEVAAKIGERYCDLVTEQELKKQVLCEKEVATDGSIPSFKFQEYLGTKPFLLWLLTDEDPMGYGELVTPPVNHRQPDQAVFNTPHAILNKVPDELITMNAEDPCYQFFQNGAFDILPYEIKPVMTADMEKVRKANLEKAVNDAEEGKVEMGGDDKLDSNVSKEKIQQEGSDNNEVEECNEDQVPETENDTTVDDLKMTYFLSIGRSKFYARDVDGKLKDSPSVSIRVRSIV